MKLTYFASHGRAGAIRKAFELGEVEYENITVNFPEFIALKPTLPWGSVPILEVTNEAGETVTHSQSNSLLRYAARIGKRPALYPVENPEAALRVDSLLDAVEDLSQALGPSYSLKGEEQLAWRKNFQTTKLEPWLKNLQRVYEQSSGDGKHAVGSALTIADLKLFYALGGLVNKGLDGIDEDVLQKTAPKLQEWYEFILKEYGFKY